MPETPPVTFLYVYATARDADGERFAVGMSRSHVASKTVALFDDKAMAAAWARCIAPSLSAVKVFVLPSAE